MRFRAPATTALLLCTLLVAIEFGVGAPQPGERVLMLASLNIPARPGQLRELAAVSRGSTEATEAEIIARMDDSFAKALTVLRPELTGLGAEVAGQYSMLGMVDVQVPRSALDALQQLSIVQRVSPVARGQAQIYRMTNQANHNADFVQNTLGVTGKGGILVMLDSGMDLHSGNLGNVHPAFQDEDGNSRVIAAFNIDANGKNDLNDLEDQSGHGTSVAGIAAGRNWVAKRHTNEKKTKENDPIRPLAADSGFAPGASIISYKVTKGGSGIGNLAPALNHLARHATEFGIDHQVLNISWVGQPSALGLIEVAMDSLVEIHDILIVTSAGNDGKKTRQTSHSHSNANGLAVASIDPDTHRVSAFSSRGPLVTDSLRLWPDISAVGADVHAPDLNNPKGVSPLLNGTSFSAPAVAGTAVLIRSLDPKLTAFDTKALLLNSVESLEHDNPLANRNAYGLGMLRTDLAVESVTSGNLFHGTLDEVTHAAQVDISVTEGETYSATLVWPGYAQIGRTNSDWDNLDLAVIDAKGITLAVSNSPHNLYERVVFRARQSGRYQLRILRRSLDFGIIPGPPPVSWTLAESIERGGGRQIGSYRLVGSACAGPAENPHDGIVIPAQARRVFGSRRTDLPFAQLPNRTQVAYPGDKIPKGLLVTKLAFRRDDFSVCAPSYRIDMAIRMGHTKTSPTQLSRYFDANPSVDTQLDVPEPPLTTVFKRKIIDLPGVHGVPGDDRPFDLIIPLDRPFLTRTDKDTHLLIDFQVFWHSRNSQPFELWFDAVEDYGSLGRVINFGDPDAVTGTQDAIAPVISLMTGAFTSTLPSLAVDRMPQLGETMTLVLRHAMPGSVGILIHSFNNQSFGDQSLPYALDGLGAKGCMLYSNVQAFVPVLVDASGQASVEYEIPDNPELTGIEFFNQFLVLSPGANELGIVTTNGGVGRIGG